MHKIKSIALLGGLLLMAGTSGGCSNKALENDYLDINTRILIHESELGGGKNLKVSVVDKRRHNIVMKKDSERKIKSGRALVSKNYHPAYELDSHLEEIATEAFRMQGYDIEGKGSGSVRELTIYITKLDLRLRKGKSESGKLPTVQARLRTKMKVAANNRGMFYVNEYKFLIKKSYPGVPEKIDSEKILNYGLTQLLHQMIDDPKLAQFLTG